MHTISEFDDWCGHIPGLTRMQDRHWANFDPAVISYPDSDMTALEAIEPRSYWFAHRNDIITSVVRQHPPAGPIFDIGGGNGFVSQALSAAGYPSVVIEPDHAGAATAHRRGLPVIEAAFQNLQLAPASLPSAAMFDVLEHIEDDQGTLRRLHGLMTPDGILYIAVPSLPALWSGEDVEAGHFRRYTRKSLDAVLARAGFTTIRSTYFFSALVPAIYLMRRVLGRRQQNERSSSAQIAAQHRLPENIIGAALKSIFERELARVDAGLDCPIGSSLLVVARPALLDANSEMKR